jgi:hypothetical protein
MTTDVEARRRAPGFTGVKIGTPYGKYQSVDNLRKPESMSREDYAMIFASVYYLEHLPATSVPKTSFEGKFDSAGYRYINVFSSAENGERTYAVKDSVLVSGCMFPVISASIPEKCLWDLIESGEELDVSKLRLEAIRLAL